MSTPRAYVLRSERNRYYPDERIVIVACPYCPVEHRHGATKGRRGDIGHKSAHCHDPYRKQVDTSLGYIVADETPVAPWEKP